SRGWSMGLPSLRIALLAAALLLALMNSWRASAQEPAPSGDPPSRVARLNYLQGSVSLQPAGETDWVGAVLNRPLTTSDRLWTDPGARAELQLGSATMRLAASTGFSFLDLDDNAIQVQLTAGTIDIRVKRLDRDEIFEIDTPNQAFSIQRPGQYRF